MAGPVVIDVVSRSAQARRDLGQVGAELRRNVAVAATVAGAAAVKLGVDAVRSASDAQQSIGATSAVFGKYADTVVRRSNDAARSIGLSANEYRELANTTGAMLQSAGTPLAKVADLTDRLNRRGADMAATFGGTTKEAVEAIGSLLRGETDPIERYGVSIRESDISARLAAKGLDDLTGSALKQAQQQERLALLFEQTGRTAGQFGRESNTLAGQQQRLGAMVENLKAKLGAQLLPVVTTVVAALIGLLPRLESWGAALRDFLSPAVEQVRTLASSLREQLEPALEFFRNHPEVIKGIAIALGIAAAAAGAFALAMLAVSLAASPITAVVLAVAAIGGAVAYAYKRSAAFRAVVGAVVDALRRFGGYVLTTVVPAVRTLAGQVGERLRPILTTIGNVFRNQIAPTVAKAAARFRELQPTIARAASIIGRAIGFIIRLAASILGRVLPALIKFGGFIFSRVVPAVVEFIGNIARAIVTVAGFGRRVGSAIATAVAAVGRFLAAVRDKFGQAVTFVGNIPGQIKSGLGALGSLLFQAGRDVIAGLVNGIRNAASSAVEAAKDVVGGAIAGAKNLLGISSPSKVFRIIGHDTIRGLVQGLRGGRAATRDTIRRIVKEIPDGARFSLRGVFTELKRLGSQQSIVNRNYERAADRLKDLTKAHRDYAKQIAAGVAAYGSISSLGEGDGYADADQLVAQRQARLQQAREFTRLIKQLRADGLNKADIDALLQQGVDGGLGAAQTIAAGGRDTIRELNVLEQQLRDVGKGLGKTGADSMYRAGIDTAKGLIRGLRTQQKYLDQIARRLATRLYREVKAALRISSPSRLFVDLGRMTAEGLRVGVRDVPIEREGTRLADALREGFGTPALDAYLGRNQPDAQLATLVAAIFAGLGTLRIQLSSEQGISLALGKVIQANLDALHTLGGSVRA